MGRWWRGRNFIPLHPKKTPGVNSIPPNGERLLPRLKKFAFFENILK